MVFSLDCSWDLVRQNVIAGGLGAAEFFLLCAGNEREREKEREIDSVSQRSIPFK
jgi:hypothetical protein